MSSDWAKSIAFCTISRLAARLGAMLSTASDKNERARVARNVDEIGVRQSMLVAQPRLGSGDRAHQIIRVQAALDQRAHRAIACQRYGALRCNKGIVRRVDERDAREIEARLRSRVLDTRFRPHQHRSQIACELA